MKRITIAIITLSLFLTWNCSNNKSNETRVKSVKIDTAQSYNNAVELLFPGKVKAVKEINLAFKVSGVIEKIPVHQGQFVKKGQVIAVMDSRDYQTQLKATTAEYNAIKGEAERIIQLYQDSSVAQNNYEKAVYGLEQISAKLKSHQDALNDTRLTAPFDGYIQKIIFDQNEIVSAGMPVISMISNTPPEVDINIPINSYIQRENFRTFSCTFDIMPNEEFPLKLIGISPKANMNQLYNVTLQFPEVQQNITPGMTTTVKIIQGSNNGDKVTIPLSAIAYKEKSPYVMRYNPNSSTIEMVKVIVESINRDSRAVITDGLNCGDIVVSAGVNSLSNGESVKPISKSSSTNIGGLL